MQKQINKLQKEVDDFKRAISFITSTLDNSSIVPPPSNQKFTAKQKKQIAASQQWNCNSCKRLLGNDYQIDHILPIFKGGTNDMNNGQALCTWCHDLKTSEETSERLAWKRVEKRQKKCEIEEGNLGEKQS